MLVNPCFYTYGTTNLAENFTQPIDYFDFGVPVRKVTLSDPIPLRIRQTVSMIVLGGGGIAHDERENVWDKLRQIVERASDHTPIVIWGMGINDHGRLDCRYDETLAYLQSKSNVLIGLRDSFYERYVPCVSCMRPEFDRTFEVTHEIGVYAHHAHHIELLLPTMTNQLEGEPEACFHRVIAFMGSCDTVITNSYHGAYWATLLNKKVIVVEPFSNKFFGFKFPPIIIQDAMWLQKAIPIARRYPEALSDSRERNRLFFERVHQFRQSFTQGSPTVGALTTSPRI